MKSFSLKSKKLAIVLMLLLAASLSVSALDTVIGEAGLLLNGVRQHVRTQETNLGNLVTDVIRWNTGADIVVYNGGGIRDSIEMGEITLESAMAVLAFQNTVVSIRLKGSEVLAAIEHGISSFPEVSGKFLQVSGIRFYFNPDNAPGQRISKAYVGKEALDPNKDYVLATNEFLVAGGDDYSMFAEAEVVWTFDNHDQAMFIRYLMSQEAPVFPTVEGRIVIQK